MDAWIKVIVVLMMVSALSMIIGDLMFDPFVGLILLSVLLTLMVVTLDPATGKAMAQVTIPIVLILFGFQVFLNPGFQFQLWMLVVVGGLLYMLFTLFTGGGGTLEGGLIDAKLSLKLFPLYGLAIIISVIVDPTRRTAVYIMVGTVGALMSLYMVFLRNYDKWPEYTYGKTRDITALTDINPKGKVGVGSEIWWARTTGPPIKQGERVIVKAMTGLTMIVARDEERYSQAVEGRND
jgi:membrane-bound ClpP family serine protease